MDKKFSAIDIGPTGRTEAGAQFQCHQIVQYCRMALRYFYVKILISVCTYLYATNSGYLPRLVRLTSFRTEF